MATQIPVIVLAAVFLLIAVRQAGGFTFRIWQVMLCGAAAVLLTGQIAPSAALAAIDMDVMLFLLGMFIVGESLVSCGYIGHVAHRLFHRADSPSRLLFAVIVAMGMLSALLMNDTLAIVGTPLCLALARRHALPDKLLLIALAVAITTGSVMSPIGNPQNLLVATAAGMPSPFVTFGTYLVIPTLLSLLAAFCIIRFFYRSDLTPRPLDPGAPVPCGGRAMLVSRCSLGIVVLLIAAKTVIALAGTGPAIPLPAIALCGAVPVLLFSKDRAAVLRNIDWATLVFFAAMFVLMASVWQTGFFQSLGIAGAAGSVPAILATSIVISQFVSNVPFVALFAPAIVGAGGSAAQALALAAGSTIAGNLTILGAASNVIVIQNAEKEGATVTFAEFARIGIPLTIVQAAIFWAFLGLA